jgi:prepilin-type N-terminal cleavage/methylation domain-containing protein
MNRPRRYHRGNGFTIIEVLIASLLLAIVIVPSLRALTTIHVNSTIMERKTRCLCLAQAKLDDIRARSIYSYSTSYAASSQVLSGSYLCTVSDTAQTANLRHIVVSVGYDDNGDHSLAVGEKLVTLETLVARRY